MKWVAAPVALSAALLLAGCTPEQQRGFLPAGSEGATNHTDGITGLWVTSWIVLLAVGVLTWGLIIWATIAYRRRKGQTGLPVQLRYNMPIETFFTVVPVILVLGFFAFTAQEQSKIESRYDNPENVVEVIGKRWAWDFNYVDEDVYFQGVQVQTDEDGEAKEETMPVLYLPVDKTTEIRLETRDVIHSFWVVEFLYKKDMIPGQTNYMSFTPTKTGTFMGKCAELCGESHSMMLFEVKVVEQDEYDAYIKSLREAGNTGQATLELNPNQGRFYGDQSKAQNE
ncbi:cytochrome c oxidase subunit II [Leucobacter luti]|uniref:cytochrome-c oxidase n=1 Tax=Leucobacter luti TaxID=340320 RepID=A0A4R6RZB3_9MICO|nr:cytochrome c oxidase subunit II [Leucobacter luti]MCW2287715.1 cytochrome c oxidase subunit 2 [Leucobacter luti]QYM76268.1 cytochrome c oxidase subunit II [Leucobacter luti]TCK46120.1 cytochrome c oxidase subunit 2 [Leucobacter luti]TDP92539.1 cytochrome c oxidase subunit 2 [Leucobacter luti]